MDSGQSVTRKVELVRVEPSGLVRVQLSLDGPPRLLGTVRARELAAELIVAAAKAEALAAAKAEALAEGDIR
jgi:hypothetical protein